MNVLMLALVVGTLLGVGTYRMLRRSPINLLVGLTMLSYGVNLLLFSSSGLMRGDSPIVSKGETTDPAGFVDPLPQALILTAIVISFAVTAFTVVLVNRAATLGIVGAQATRNTGTGTTGMEDTSPEEQDDSDEAQRYHEAELEADLEPAPSPPAGNDRRARAGAKARRLLWGRRRAKEREADGRGTESGRQGDGDDDEDYEWLDLTNSRGESLLQRLMEQR